MPYVAALSDEPCPTKRTRRPRSRATAATRAYSSSCSSNRSSARGCSWISPRKSWPGTCSGGGPGDDTRLASEEHRLHFEVVVEYDEIRRAADGEAADVVPAQDLRGHRRRRGEGELERHPEPVQVANGVDHRQNAARENSVRPAHGAVVDAEVDAPHAVRLVAAARRPDGARHERKPSGRLAPDEQRRL